MSSPVRREMPFQGMPQPGRTVEVQPGQTREVNVGGYIAFETTTQGVGSSLERLNSLNLSINFQSNFSQVPNPEFTTVFLEDDQGQITRLFGYGHNSAAPGAWSALTDNKTNHKITRSDSFVIGKSFTYSYESGVGAGIITTGRIKKITIVDSSHTATSSLPDSHIDRRWETYARISAIDQGSDRISIFNEKARERRGVIMQEREERNFSNTELRIHRAIGTREFIARFRQMPGFRVFPSSGFVDGAFWHEASTIRGARRPDPAKFYKIGDSYHPRFFMIPPVPVSGMSARGIPSEHMTDEIIYSPAGYTHWSMQLSGYFAYDQSHQVLNFIGIVYDHDVKDCKIVAYTISGNEIHSAFLPGTNTLNKESPVWGKIRFGEPLCLNSTSGQMIGEAQLYGDVEELSHNQSLLTKIRQELSQRTKVGKFSN